MLFLFVMVIMIFVLQKIQINMNKIVRFHAALFMMFLIVFCFFPAVNRRILVIFYTISLRLSISFFPARKGENDFSIDKFPLPGLYFFIQEHRGTERSRCHEKTVFAHFPCACPAFDIMRLRFPGPRRL